MKPLHEHFLEMHIDGRIYSHCRDILGVKGPMHMVWDAEEVLDEAVNIQTREAKIFAEKPQSNNHRGTYD